MVSQTVRAHIPQLPHSCKCLRLELTHSSSNQTSTIITISCYQLLPLPHPIRPPNYSSSKTPLRLISSQPHSHTRPCHFSPIGPFPYSRLRLHEPDPAAYRNRAPGYLSSPFHPSLLSSSQQPSPIVNSLSLWQEIPSNSSSLHIPDEGLRTARQSPDKSNKDSMTTRLDATTRQYSTMAIYSSVPPPSQQAPAAPSQAAVPLQPIDVETWAATSALQGKSVV